MKYTAYVRIPVGRVPYLSPWEHFAKGVELIIEKYPSLDLIGKHSPRGYTFRVLSDTTLNELEKNPGTKFPIEFKFTCGVKNGGKWRAKFVYGLPDEDDNFCLGYSVIPEKATGEDGGAYLRSRVFPIWPGYWKMRNERRSEVVPPEGMLLIKGGELLPVKDPDDEDWGE